MAVYFISDLHLSPSLPKVSAGLQNLLTGEAANADALYILGDFFDAWIGDDDDGDTSTSIQSLLKRYTSTGIPTFFLHGNRDFLIGEQFAANTQIKLLKETEVIDLYGRPTLIMHGDTLCTEDEEYFKFREMVRNPAWQQQVLGLPLSQRRIMAEQLRAQSKSMNAMKASDIMDVTQAEVEQVMQNAQVDLLIHGHTHRPAKHTLSLAGKAAERIVLGDWHDTGWYLKADADGSLNLVEFNLS